MYMRMGTKAKQAAKYWVDKFSPADGILDREDLDQEAYLVFIHCQSNHDPSRSSFITFYSRCLRNHFVDLYRYRAKLLDREQLTLDVTLEYHDESYNGEVVMTVLDLLPSRSWTLEEDMRWRELISEVEGHLSGLALKVFQVIMDSPLELLKLTKTGRITRTALRKYFGVKIAVIDASKSTMCRAVLLALGEKPKEILRQLRNF